MTRKPGCSSGICWVSSNRLQWANLTATSTAAQRLTSSPTDFSLYFSWTCANIWTDFKLKHSNRARYLPTKKRNWLRQHKSFIYKHVNQTGKSGLNLTWRNSIWLDFGCHHNWFTRFAYHNRVSRRSINDSLTCNINETILRIYTRHLRIFAASDKLASK